MDELTPASVADAVVAKLNTIPAEVFDWLIDGQQRFALLSVNASLPMWLDVQKSSTAIIVRVVDSFGRCVAQFIYGRGQSDDG